jgi:hypothetical protein
MAASKPCAVSLTLSDEFYQIHTDIVHNWYNDTDRALLSPRLREDFVRFRFIKIDWPFSLTLLRARAGMPPVLELVFATAAQTVAFKLFII